MPDVEIRPAHAEEMDTLNFILRTVFAGDDDPDRPQTLQPDWTLCAFEDGEMATSFGAYPLRWRLNGAQVDVAAVTAVGTMPNKRRRGYLRRIMTQSFRDQRDAGQHFAILWASHAAYQRYGYAVTGMERRYDVSPRDIRFTSGPRPSGAIRVPTEPEIETLRDVYRRYISARNGELSRVPVMWDLLFSAFKEEKPVYQAIYEEDGVPLGYVIYRQKDAYEEFPEESMRLRVVELIWNTPGSVRRAVGVPRRARPDAPHRVHQRPGGRPHLPPDRRAADAARAGHRRTLDPCRRHRTRAGAAPLRGGGGPDLRGGGCGLRLEPGRLGTGD